MMFEPPAPNRRLLRDSMGDLRQLASVRRIVLDDGPERGQRALHFSSGGGLDFWVLSDRTMDIGPLWFKGMPIAWQHPNGYIAPDLFDARSDDGTGFERALSGFMVTCGLAHSRQPRGGNPLHGSLPLTPARVMACGEDWDAPTPLLYAVGEIVTAHLNGPSFRLRRRVEAPIGGQGFALIDRIENIGQAAQELHVLYHTNFGFPAVQNGTSARQNGALRMEASLPGIGDGAAQPQVLCYPAGPGETMTLELERAATGPWPSLRVVITAPAAALPFAQFWSDPRPRRNILAIEPATSGRAPDGTSLPGPVLRPGEAWSSRLDFDFSSPPA